MPRKRSLLLPLALVATSCLRSQAPELIVEYLDHAPPARGEPRAAKSLFLHVQMSMSSASQRRAIAGRLGLPFLRCLHPEAAGATFFASDPLGGIPGDPRIRALTASGIAVQVLTRGVSAEETLAAAMSETHPYAVLIGASAGASPKPGWRRVEHATLDREIWTRGVRLEPRSIEGAPLRFAVTKIPGKRSFEAITKTPVYPEHLQGVARDPDGNIYWSWTDRIIKSDSKGRILLGKPAPTHQGDLCWHEGKIVVAVNLGKFNDLEERHDSWAYIYDAKTLELLSRHALPEARFGAGGVCWHEGSYYIVGGLPREWEKRRYVANEIHQYDEQWRFLRTVHLPSGWTRLGIQTAEFAYGRFWFGCYRDVTLIASPDLRHVQRLEDVFCAYGLVKGPNGTLLVSRDEKTRAGHRGGLVARPLPWFWRKIQPSVSPEEHSR
jgi:hypothetical protein